MNDFWIMFKNTLVAKGENNLSHRTTEWHAFYFFRRNLSAMTVYVIPRPILLKAKSISSTKRLGIYYLINEIEA